MHDREVGVAHAAGSDLDDDVAGSGSGGLEVLDRQGLLGPDEDCCAHDCSLAIRQDVWAVRYRGVARASFQAASHRRAATRPRPRRTTTTARSWSTRPAGIVGSPATRRRSISPFAAPASSQTIRRAAFERGVGERHPAVALVGTGRGDEPVGLAEHRVAGHERRGVTVVAEAEVHDVEHAAGVVAEACARRGGPRRPGSGSSTGIGCQRRFGIEARPMKLDWMCVALRSGSPSGATRSSTWNTSTLSHVDLARRERCAASATASCRR